MMLFVCLLSISVFAYYLLFSHSSFSWDTLQNQTTLYLIIYALGIGALTNFPSIVSVYMQF